MGPFDKEMEVRCRGERLASALSCPPATQPAKDELASPSWGQPSPHAALRPLRKDVLGRVGGEQSNSSSKLNLVPSSAMMTDPLGSLSHPQTEATFSL